MTEILCSVHDRGGLIGTTDVYILNRGNDPIIFRELMQNLTSGKIITLIMDNKEYKVQIKGSFATTCRHIYDGVNGGIYTWITKNGLKPTDRVLLEIVEPYEKFRLKLMGK